MVKDATTWKAWLPALATFWGSFLVSSAVVNCLPLQATPYPKANRIAQLNTHEVPETVATSSIPQKAASVEAAGKTPTVGDVTSVVELTSAQKDSDINKDDHTPTFEADPAKVSASAPTADDNFSTQEDIDSNDPMSQVTNVSQLRDVSPGDWAYEALRNIVERYGCIAGYPDGTFRGNRPLSRYEFAAGLNACLQQVERLIASGAEGSATRKDFETLQRLVEGFRPELAALGTRVDNLESRTAFLENRQFSTTTKLFGLAWFNVTGAGAGGNVKVETIDVNVPLAFRSAGRDSTGKPIVRTAEDPSITASDLVFLTLYTSFTGRDALTTTLAVGNGDSAVNAYASAGLYYSFGTPFFDQTPSPNPGVNEVVVRNISYQFPVTNNFQVVVGPRINWNAYFDSNALSPFLTGASSYNSTNNTLLNAIERGAGAILLWDINKQFKLHVGYLGENNEFLPSQFGFNSASNPAKGVFGPSNTTTAELTFSPSDTFNLRLLYNYSNLDPTVPIFTQLADGTVVQTGMGVGGSVNEPILGVIDDGFGGSINNVTAHTFAVNFDWRISPGFGLFGRYGYGTANVDPITSGRSGGRINVQSFQLGLAFPDLGKQGAFGTLTFVIPRDFLRGEKFLAAGGGNGGMQYEVEATYFYPLTNNIAIVPAFYLIANPNNFDDNPTIYVGNIRAQFSF